jgi:hypothetical protein
MIAQFGGQVLSNTSASEVKAGGLIAVSGVPTRLFNLLAFNPGASVSYLQFFDALTANVTVGSTTPTFVIPMPAGGGVHTAMTVPYQFNTGIMYAVTLTPTGAGAPASNAVVSFTYF